MEAEFAEEDVVENPTLKAAYNLAPLHQNQPLRWDYEVDLLGEKIYDKVIHLCEICELPILVYGRMLPCKHIFCFDCARKCEKTCKRCSARVQKVEKSALGTVFVCTHGAPKHSTKGCRRTYLSQRDLQSHIAHRHMPKASDSKHQPQPVSSTPQVPLQLPLTQQQAAQQAAQQGPVSVTTHGTPTSLQAHLTPPMSIPGQTPAVALAPNLPPLHPGLPGMGGNTPQHSPALPLSTNLSEGRPSMVTPGPTITNQNSPHLPPAHSPNLLPPALGLPFSGQAQTNSEQHHYRPMDMAPHAQQQQHQHSLGIMGSHMQPAHGAMQQQQQSYGQATQPPISSPIRQQSYGQSAQSSISSPMMQQMGGTQQMPPVMSPQMHSIPQHHQQQQHSSLQGAKNMDNYSPQNVVPALQQNSQSRTNVNLITVPIQDESQYRPTPYANTAGAQNCSNNNSFPAKHPSLPSNLSNLPPHSQAFSPVSTMGSSTFSNTRSYSPRTGNAGPQNMGRGGNSSPHNLQFNQAGNLGLMRDSQPGMGASNLRSNVMRDAQPGMGGSNLPPNVMRDAQPDMGASNLRPNVMRDSQPGMGGSNLPPNVMRDSQPGIGASNLPPNVPQAFAGVVQAMSMMAARAGGSGLMPTPGNAGQGNAQHFSSGNRWTNPRGIQPRMTQGQPRPRADSQFNPNYYN